MKLKAVLKQRNVPVVVMGFWSTKFAPMAKASLVVVLPFKMANDTEVLLLAFWRKLRSTSTPPCRSSQSIITASNLADDKISAPDRAAAETSTSIESFSRVGRKTRTTSVSRHTSRDSNVIAYYFRAVP